MGRLNREYYRAGKKSKKKKQQTFRKSNKREKINNGTKNYHNILKDHILDKLKESLLCLQQKSQRFQNQ